MKSNSPFIQFQISTCTHLLIEHHHRHHPMRLFLHWTLIFALIFFFFPITLRRSTAAACSSKCGSLDILYPLGTAYGCGSPHFYPFVSCDSANDQQQLTLTTHTGKYPIASISYSTSTLTIIPPHMSTCSSAHPAAPNLGLDWSSPFQLSPSSVLLLLACPDRLATATLCDAASGPRLCGSLLACAALTTFAPASTCCVYSPRASLGPAGELNLHALHCSAYTSVASLGKAAPTDAATWEYGVVLQWGEAEIEVDGAAEACAACERSEGICGYAPPRNYFVCVCRSGVNTSTDCYGQNGELKEYYYWQSSAIPAASRHGNYLWMLMAMWLVVHWS